jgi:dienelactone hydrolase
MPCTNISWDSSSTWLALVCQPPAASTPALYVWTPGALAISIVSSTAPLRLPIQWLPRERVLLYVATDSGDYRTIPATPAPIVPASLSVPDILPNAPGGVSPCAAIGPPHLQHLTVDCSSNFDVFRATKYALPSMAAEMPDDSPSALQDLSTRTVRVMRYSVRARRSTIAAVIRDGTGIRQRAADIEVASDGQRIFVLRLGVNSADLNPPLYTTPGAWLKTPATERISQTFTLVRSLYAIGIAANSDPQDGAPILDLSEEPDSRNPAKDTRIQVVRADMAGASYLPMYWAVAMGGRNVAWKTRKATIWGPNQNYQTRPSSDTVDVIHIALAGAGAATTVVLDGRDTEEDKSFTLARMWHDPAAVDMPQSIHWTPDGKRVLAVSLGALWLIDAGTGSARKIPNAPSRVVTHVLWHSNAEALVSTVDVSTGRSGAWWITFDSGPAARAVEWACALLDGPSQLQVSRGIVGRTTTVAFVGSTIRSPYNVYVQEFGPDGVSVAAPHPVTRIDVDRQLPIIEDKVFAFRPSPTRWGYGLLIRPAGTTRPLPTIVLAYPGARTVTHVRFQLGADNFEFVDLFASLQRGFAVLLVDIPMEDLGEYGARGPAEDIVHAVTVSIDEAARSGWMDTERLGVSGHSYGGYMVNLLVARTNRFRAAVSMSSMADIVRDAAPRAYDTYWVEAQGRMGKTIAEAPDRYVLNSPIFGLENATTPLLLMHGVEDSTYDVSQSEEMFVALATLLKPVALERYRNVGHVPKEPWRWWGRALDWFDEHLRI